MSNIQKRDHCFWLLRWNKLLCNLFKMQKIWKPAGRWIFLSVTLSIQINLSMAHAEPILSTLASFQGEVPTSLALDGKGNLFGTTLQLNYTKKNYASGTVFEIVKGSQARSVIASFLRDSPLSVALDGDGNLFGTTVRNAYTGTIFEIKKDSQVVITLASFHGEVPGKVSLDKQGNIFGTTSKLGSKGFSVFELMKGSHAITILASINGFAAPETISLDSKGDIFGMRLKTDLSGSSIFEIVKSSHAVTTLASFQGVPLGGISVDTQGNIFGTVDNTFGSTIFELIKGNNTVITLASFEGLEGAVTLDNQGNIFGMRDKLDSRKDVTGGNIFEIGKSTQTVITLTPFQDEQPQEIIFDSKGNIFGRTARIGLKGGRVFEIR